MYLGQLQVTQNILEKFINAATLLQIKQCSQNFIMKLNKDENLDTDNNFDNQLGNRNNTLQNQKYEGVDKKHFKCK